MCVRSCRALVGGGSGGSTDPPLFERDKEEMMIFLGDLTASPVRKKFWTPQFQNADKGPGSHITKFTFLKNTSVPRFLGL